jgi:hypothetical protein
MAEHERHRVEVTINAKTHRHEAVCTCGWKRSHSVIKNIVSVATAHEVAYRRDEVVVDGPR